MNTIGMVSRLETGKGQDVLIDAATILKAEFKNIKVLIIGEGPTLALSQKIKKFKLDDNIRLMGFQKDLKKVFRNLDVFVFPSYWPLEGFGMVLLEAMNYGVPIVATDFGPIPEIVSDVALLVPPKDPRALASALKKVITNKSLRNSMITKGRIRVKNFDIKNIADKYHQTLLDVIKSNV